MQSGKFTNIKKIGWGIGILLILLIFQSFIILVGRYSIATVMHSREKSLLLLEAIAAVQASLAEIQSGMRGYVATGDKDFLSLHDQGLRELERDWGNLHQQALTPQQAHQIQTLDKIIPEYLSSAAKVVKLYENQGFEPAKKLLATREGKIWLIGPANC